MAVLEKEISPESYTLNEETASDTLTVSPFGGHDGSITKENISRKLYTKRRDRDALEASHASRGNLWFGNDQRQPTPGAQ